MLEYLTQLWTELRGPNSVQWAGELYSSDIEFRLAIEDGVPPQKLESAVEQASSKEMFRQQVLDAYYESI